MTRYGTPPGGLPEGRGALATDAVHVGILGDGPTPPAREAGRPGAARHSRVAAA
ncbi:MULTISPECIES: hypothetical protein [unclassified Pseudofrankia]|uniref:hypothetical protein n=1 Tax=unclassified Pseudofrankia TaxID=2994372 RepID=UPI0012FFAD76|nr:MULTISPECIES: hypothetical protein [unclassified Pseudofrankia]MDT3440254.1 hypothetical protein [Pseudofrankia sp. BMG5.37]